MPKKYQCIDCGKECFGVRCRHCYSKQPSPKKGIPTGHVPRSAFKKGNIPWNKDRQGCFSEQTLKKMSIAHKGQKPAHAGGELLNLQWDKHHKFKDGRRAYKRHLIRNGVKPVCRVCGKKGKFERGSIEVHHINKDRTNNNLDNLMPLCVLHHKRIDRGKIPCPNL